jgi:hypothetical protein
MVRGGTSTCCVVDGGFGTGLVVVTGAAVTATAAFTFDDATASREVEPTGCAGRPLRVWTAVAVETETFWRACGAPAGERETTLSVGAAAGEVVVRGFAPGEIAAGVVVVVGASTVEPTPEAIPVTGTGAGAGAGIGSGASGADVIVVPFGVGAAPAPSPGAVATGTGDEPVPDAGAGSETAAPGPEPLERSGSRVAGST